MKTMQKELGPKMAKKLQQRMMELDTVDTLADISHLPPPRCHELTGKRIGQFSVDLVHPYRLIFIPADDPIPQNEEGKIDISQVSEIEIIEIKDTH